MRVLFVVSAKSICNISPITYNQAVSLQKAGVEVEFFRIMGKGLKGYLKSINPLAKQLRINSYDVIHAHYSLSAFVASFAGAKPLVVSLMGSDVKSKNYFKFLIRLFNKFSWTKIIVKSEDMKASLDLKNISVIPNGVDINLFKPLKQEECKKRLNWSLNKKQILFAANPKRHEKNFELAQAAFSLIENSDFELKVLNNIPNKEMPIYHNAADVILLTSLWEGSPNVIKEAMACNRPIVSTNVGDVEWLFGGERGLYLSKFDPIDCARNITFALEQKDSCGLTRISKLKLDSNSVSLSLVKLYLKFYTPK